MSECPECYSDRPRITPLINVAQCLKEHKQYICGTCGRAICVDKGINGKYRVMLPFKTLRIAKYYLRAAEIVNNSTCEIYEFVDNEQRKFYMIFKDQKALNEYLAKNDRFTLSQRDPLLKSPLFRQFHPHQCRRMSENEINTYIGQRQGRF